MKLKMFGGIAMVCMAGPLALAAPNARSTPAFARDMEPDPVLQLSLDDYVKRAVEAGIQGRKNMLDFERAGYTREILFRATEAPSFSVGHTIGRSETDIGGQVSTLEATRNTTLDMAENTPLGTRFTGSAGYGDTIGATDGIPEAASGQKPNAKLDLNQPLYLFVRNPVARQRKQAQLDFENAQSDLDSLTLSLRAQARNFYYSIMQQEELIHVNQRKADASRKLLDVTQALVDAGKSAPVETARTKIQWQTDLRTLENSVTARDQAKLSAKNLIAMPLEQDVEFTSQLSSSTFNVPLDKLINYALIHQPGMQALRRQQEIALLAWQAAQEATRPAVFFDGHYNYGEQPTFFSQTSYSRGWSWTLNASWLFFDSGVTRDAVKNAQIQRTVADLNLDDGERTTQLSIRNNYLDVKRAEKQIQDFQSQREQAERNVEILRLRFQNGLTTLIDVLTAENDMRDLDNEYLGLLVTFNQSKDQLSIQVGADVDTL
jgi:outer membrane protein